MDIFGGHYSVSPVYYVDYLQNIFYIIVFIHHSKHTVTKVSIIFALQLK